MAFQIKFGSLTLDGLQEWTESHDARILEHTFPRRPGSIAPRVPTAEARKVTVTGELWGASESVLKTALDDLRHALTDLGRDKLYLRDDGRYLNAVKSRFSYHFSAAKLPTMRADISIDFLADDPFWYGAQQTQTDALTGTSATFSLTNNGAARTPPVFEIVRGAGTDQNDVTLTNTTTGIYVKWSGTFVVGTKLIFDMVNRRVTMAGALALNASSGQLAMHLEPGLNNFNYAGPGNVSVTTAYLERWS